MRCRTTRSPQEAADALRAGRLVALPTETVYGLGANALDVRAVAEIFAAKERPAFDPLIVHIHSVEWLPRVASDFPSPARRLAEAFWPGPLTLVLPKNPSIPDLVTSGLATVGVRIPDHPLMRQVLELADVPIAAPSANRFGRLSPTTAEHVIRQLGTRIDLVLDGGPCRVGVESTIVQCCDRRSVLLRPGGIAVEELERIVGPLEFPTRAAVVLPTAPGQLPSHYAPHTPLTLVDELPPVATMANAGALGFTPRPLSGYCQTEFLSKIGDLTEAAANFFPALHRLDDGQLEVIVAERLPNVGLGRALNDRLERAAARP